MMEDVFIFLVTQIFLLNQYQERKRVREREREEKDKNDDYLNHYIDEK